MPQRLTQEQQAVEATRDIQNPLPWHLRFLPVGLLAAVQFIQPGVDAPDIAFT